MKAVKVGSYGELFKNMEKILKESLEELTEQAVEDLKTEVDKTVYGAGNPQKYQRTYDFRESITKTKAERQDDTVSVRIHHDTDAMRLQSDYGKFVHGSFGGDFRTYLPYVINYGQDGEYARVGDLFGAGLDKFWWNSRPYWSNFIERFEQYAKADFKKILKEKGLNIK